MNTADRAYHHGDLRQSLIEEACKHLRESGADTLSLRALARDLGVSQTAPYRHFPSKNALFAAIATYGFELMQIELQKASDNFPDDVEQAFVETGLAYVIWAQNNPEKYQLFFDSSLVDFSNYADLQDASDDAFQILIAVIEKGIQQDIFIDRPVLELAGAAWASVHGTASLLIAQMNMIDKDMKGHSAAYVMELLAEHPRRALELFLNALRKPC